MSHLFGPSLLLTALLALACTAPTPTLVAQERPAPLPPLDTTNERGRVLVVDGQLVTDRGSPLRGLTLAVDFQWSLDDFEVMTTIAQTTGLNTVHVYLENWKSPPGDKQLMADALVSLTAQAGLYLVLGIGGGVREGGRGGNGHFEQAKITEFWNRYASRYAAHTHVLYEIQNNPEVTCESDVQPETIIMEREAYKQIRALAPDTHIVLFSTSSVPRLNVVERAIDGVSDVVDFNNASFAMHTDDVCTPVADLGTVFAGARKKGVAVLVSALPTSQPFAPVVTACEDAGVGWIHHRWLALNAPLEDLFTEVADAKLTWCPDQGDYPQPATDCSQP